MVVNKGAQIPAIQCHRLSPPGGHRPRFVAVGSGCFVPSNGAKEGVDGLQLYWQDEAQGRSARRRRLCCCCWGRHVVAGGAATAAGARGNGEPMPALSANIV
jgi:hypothetical protein